MTGLWDSSVRLKILCNLLDFLQKILAIYHLCYCIRLFLRNSVISLEFFSSHCHRCRSPLLSWWKFTIIVYKTAINSSAGDSLDLCSLTSLDGRSVIKIQELNITEQLSINCECAKRNMRKLSSHDAVLTLHF